MYCWRAQVALVQRDLPKAELAFADTPPLEADATPEQMQRLHFQHARPHRF